MVKHGQALAYLQKRESSDYFCFMDSDILATGDFLSALVPDLTHQTAMFSGSPLWSSPNEQVLPDNDTRMRGWYSTTHTGVCLGSTYFAIYDNDALTRCVDTTGIDFCRYSWSNVPISHQQQLREMGLQKDVYDTGKLLNLLLFTEGRKLVNQNSPCLQHLGGISTYQAGLRSQQLTSGTILNNLLAELPKSRAYQLLTPLARREVTLEYFTQLFESLFNSQPLPSLPQGINDPAIEKKVTDVTNSIVFLYQEFGNKFSSHG